MFCSKCGAPIGEKARFCGVCGNVIDPDIRMSMQQHEAALRAETVPESVQQQPVQQQPVQQQSVQQQSVQQVQYQQQPVQQQVQYQQPVQPAEKPMNKLKFAYTRGGVVSWVSFAVLLLATALIGLSLYTALYTSFLELPVVKLTATVAGESIKDLEDTLADGQDILDEGWEAVDEVKQEKLTKEEKEYVQVAEEVLEDMETMLDTPSLMILYNVVHQLSENEEVYEILEMSEGKVAAKEQQEMKDISDVLGVVACVIAGCFGLALLLTFLAAMFRSNVLTVFGMLAAVGICTLLANPVYGIAVLVLDIVAIVLNAIIRKNYKAYKRQTMGC